MKRWAEAGFAALCLSVFIWFLRTPLFAGLTTFAHDNALWNFPLFHFYAETLLQGNLPLWNPYSHGGEPFYPILGQMRLLEPLTLLTVLLGRWFTTDLILLFNWHRVINCLWMVSGIYLVLRPFAKHLSTKLTLIAVLFFSSTILGTFRADGYLNNFLWIPFLAYFLIRILCFGDYRRRNWVALAITTGINFQNYFFVAPLLFLFFFVLAQAFFNRQSLLRLWKYKANFRSFPLFVVITSLFLLPNLVILLESSRFLYPVRLLPTNFATEPARGGQEGNERGPQSYESRLKMPYEAVRYSGTQATLWNYVQTLSPEGNPILQSYRSPAKSWGAPAEAFLYLGMLPWIFSLLGIFTIRTSLEKTWGFLAFVFAGLSLGANSPLHPLLYPALPPLWFLRHTEFFIPLVGFCLLALFVSGYEKYLEGHASLKHPVIATGIALAIQILFILGHHSDKSLFVRNLVLFAALPLALMTSAKLRQKRRNRGILISGTILLIAVSSELLYRFHNFDLLFNGTLSPSLLTNSAPKAQPFTLPTRREVTPLSPDFLNERYQNSRYLELLYRKSYAFSSVRKLGSGKDTFEKSLRGTRWNSYLLLRPHFEIMHANLPPTVLESIFGINQPLFQFTSRSIPYPQGQFVPKVKEESARIKELLKTTVFLESDSSLFSSRAGLSNAKVTPRLVSCSSNSLEVLVDTSENGYFIWNDAFDPHWKATLNGNEATIYRANGLGKAVLLPQGESRLIYEYRPTAYLGALAIFYGIFLFGAVFFFRDLARNRGKISLNLEVPLKGSIGQIGQT